MSDPEQLVSDRFLMDFVENTMPKSLRRFLGASDLVQSVWIKVQKYRGSFAVSDENHYRRWVLCIARQKIIDKLRYYRLTEAKRRADSNQPLPPDRFSLTSSQLDACQMVVLKEEADRLLEALIDLPPDVQQIVSLRYREELSFHEIAEQLDMPVTTCRRRWLEGCELLRSKLSDILYR